MFSFSYNPLKSHKYSDLKMGFKSVCVLLRLYWFTLSQLFWVIHWYFIILHAIHAVGSLQIGRSILKVIVICIRLERALTWARCCPSNPWQLHAQSLPAKLAFHPQVLLGSCFLLLCHLSRCWHLFGQTSDARTIWAFSMLVFLFFWEQMLKRWTWAIKISFYIAFQLLSVCMFYHVDWNMI